MEFIPLQITAILQDNVAGDQQLAIDSILEAALCKRDYPELYYAPKTIGHFELKEFDLPLQKNFSSDGRWYYSASFAAWPKNSAYQLQHWNKRFDQKYTYWIDFNGRRGSVMIQSGRYKAIHMPTQTRSAAMLRWWVVGDIELITGLLKEITHIGKKRSCGYGNVIQWIVEPIKRDLSCYQNSYPVRAIPVDISEVEKLLEKIPDLSISLLAGYRPPYWHPERQGVALVPNKKHLVFD